MLDDKMSECSRASFFTTLMFRKELSRVVANSNCILIEPISAPNLRRTLIPLNQVICVTSCTCKKITKKLICKCISSSNRTDSASTTTSPSSSSSSGRSSADSRTSDLSCSTTIESAAEIQAVRVYYAVPVGKYQWKVAFALLLVPDDEEQQQEERKLDKKTQQQDGSHPMSLTEQAALSLNQRSAFQNQVVGWVSNVMTLLESFTCNRPKKLLVFINPFGGRRKGPQIYRQKVEPVFRLAGIHADVILTERANHARDKLQDITTPIKEYDGFVCVGGDGMFSEMVNGIVVRTQLEQGINYQSAEVKLSRPGIPVGVIPAGSTDAVAFGVTGINDPLTSAIHVIFGRSINIDVSAVHDSHHDERFLRYVTSVLGYGFLADVLLESEKNRWMGPKRYDWAGFKKLLSLKAYYGEIKLHVSAIDGSPRDEGLCESECPLCAKSLLRSKYSGNEKITISEDTGEKASSSVLTIRGRFLSVNAATMACRCVKSRNGLSPAAHLGNGCSDLIVVSECSRLDYIRFLMRTGFTTSQSAFDLPFVDVYRVTEFSYRPISSSDSSSIPRRGSSVSTNNNKDFLDDDPDDHNNGVWNCDGEVIESSAIRVVNHCQLLPVFGVGLENRFLNRNMAETLSSSKKKLQRDLNIRHPIMTDEIAPVDHKNVQQQTSVPCDMSDVSLIITPATPNNGLSDVPQSVSTKL